MVECFSEKFITIRISIHVNVQHKVSAYRYDVCQTCWMSSCNGAVIADTYKGSGQYVTWCRRRITFHRDHRVSTGPSGIYGTIVSLRDHQVCMGPSCLYGTIGYVWDHRVSTGSSGMCGTIVSLRDHQVFMGSSCLYGIIGYVWDHCVSTGSSGIYGTIVSLRDHRVCMGPSC